MISRILVLLVVIILLVSICNTNALFGSKKEENKNEKISAKDSLALGLESMMKMGNDPQAMKEYAEMLKDPNTMAG